MSRRRSNRITKPKPLTDAHSVTIIDDDCEEDEYANHRSCWKHIAALSTRDSKLKHTKEDFEVFKRIAQCSYEENPRRKRSSRRIKCKYFVPNLQKKLNSKTFTNCLEDVWRGFSDEKRNSFGYLDCLWFSMYKGDCKNIRDSVFNSIKKKQIFSKQYVFLPIVYWSHWNLLIFCNFGDDLSPDHGNTCMLLLDSLKTTGACQRLEPDIRKFVMEIYRIERKTEDPLLVDEIPLYVPEVPQQTNDVECGSFVLFYIQRFIEDAPKTFISFTLILQMKEDWFSHEHLEEFCKKLDSLGTIH